MQWEVVIGLETHVQLLTQSKIFSGASTRFGAEPNTQACPVDLALPGVLPVLNRRAVEHAIRFGLAIGARVAPVSIFARKNYFYPDLPKGYQISQYEQGRDRPSSFCWPAGLSDVEGGSSMGASGGSGGWRTWGWGTDRGLVTSVCGVWS